MRGVCVALSNLGGGLGRQRTEEDGDSQRALTMQWRLPDLGKDKCALE